MQKNKISRKQIGWREFVSLPNLKVKQIKVKVDTGATTSALHAEDIVIFSRSGKKKVSFTIYPLQKNKVKKVVATADLIEMRNVRSSTGHLTKRPVIKTLIKIGDEEPYEIELTLVNRDIMGFRMLLGRKALKKRFLVHPDKSYLFLKLTLSSSLQFKDIRLKNIRLKNIKQKSSAKKLEK